MPVMKALALLVLLSSLGTSVLSFAQVGPENSFQPLPQIKAWVVEQSSTLDPKAADTFRVIVHIPPDHHGYLDKGTHGFFLPLAFSLPATEEQGVRVVTIARPAGTWDAEVQATVLRESGEFALRLEPPGTIPDGQALTVGLRYQICNDVTRLCYPPQNITIPLQVRRLADGQSHISPPASTPQFQVPSLSLTERVTALFQQHMTNSVYVIALVFVAGLLAAATPCVYPIMPLTSALLHARGAGSRHQGRLHALVYFLGIICFYACLGLLAATTGVALSAVMTNAWVNLGLAILFAYLGLSMLGLYEFQFLPSVITNVDAAVSRLGGLSGTFVMGTTAGLVVSPCIGPIVGAILLDISGQVAGMRTPGDLRTTHAVVRGVIYMASFGGGLGLPFLLVGMLSHRLPQSGVWLTRVKWLLGLPILYFAYTYYMKGMETATVPPHIAHAMLIGVLATGSSVLLGAFHALGDKPSQGMLLRRAGGLIVFIIGVHFLYNGLGQSGLLLPLPRESSNDRLAEKDTTPQIEATGNLRWLRDFTFAQEQAQREHKPLFVDFYATWCANCKAFQHLAVNNTTLNTALQRAVLVKIYDTDTMFRVFQQDHRFPELRGIGGQPLLPLFAIYSSQGLLTWKGQDYQAISTMVAQLERVKRPGMP